jgi:hypothetical protein
MKKFNYCSAKAKALNFDLASFDECVESPFVVKSTFVKIDDGSQEKGYRKLAKGEVYKADDERVHVYAVLAIEGQTENLGIDMQVLNTCEGWLDCINVTETSFSLKDGVRVSITGKTLMFNLK